MSLFAQKADMPDIYKNWEESFGDTKEEIADFFETFAGRVRVCVLRKEGTVTAQLCLLPVMVMDCEAEYLYAVATGPAYRGEGLCTQLLQEVARLLKKEGKCGILVPADAKLQSFYKKRGFKDCYIPESLYLRAAENTVEYATDTEIRECTVKQYIALRQQAFANGNCVIEPEYMLQYALAGYLQNGFQLAQFLWKGKRYGVLYQKAERVLIQEITVADSTDAIEAGEAFLTMIGQKEAWLQRSYLTMGVYLPEEIKEDGYFNLVLD